VYGGSEGGSFSIGFSETTYSTNFVNEKQRKHIFSPDGRDITDENIRDKKRNELNTFMEKAVSFLLIQDQARSITVL